jgi:predicted flavoprotein YhiN
MLLEGRGRGTLAILREHLPDRLARRLCELADAPTTGDLTREARKRLVTLLTGTPLAVTGDRGFTLAEATAGGVPLSEVRLDTMESRLCPGLHFAGEVLDVDGRIGGFNFQWAWASGFLAGTAAAGS